MGCRAVWVFVARWLRFAHFDWAARFSVAWHALAGFGAETRRHRGEGGLGIELSVARMVHLYREARCCATGTLRAHQTQKCWVFGRILGVIFLFLGLEEVRA